MLTQLINLGLTDKEAKTYLASLELGTSSIQKIAEKAKVNRATTYVIIEDLIKKGLVSSFEQGKKTYFAATHPSQLLRIVREKQVELKQAEENLEKEILPELLSIHNVAEDQPKVRFFEGKEGIEAINNEFEKIKNKIIKTPMPFIEIIISQNKISFISLKKEKSIGIIIEDKSIAQSVLKLINASL